MALHTERYFLGILPPEYLRNTLEAWKTEAYQLFQTRGALASPAHLTLFMPFNLAEARLNHMLESLTAFAQTVADFEVVLSGISGFPPRVVFVDVVANEKLTQLQRALQQLCRSRFSLAVGDYKDQPFHPHITIAFRDLKKSHYATALHHFQAKGFHASFWVKHLVLFRYNLNLKQWEIFHEFPLRSPNSPEAPRYE